VRYASQSKKGGNDLQVQLTADTILTHSPKAVFVNIKKEWVVQEKCIKAQ
jgi:hypothetical protein